MDHILKLSGIVAWAFLLLLLAIRWYYGKDWMKKLGISLFLGPPLHQSMHKLASEFPKDIQKETVADVGTNLIRRFVRIGLAGLMLALIPLALLFQQNQLLTRQNEKLDDQNIMFNTQNERINLQNNLLEADRRSSLVFLMSNLLDKMDDEITT